MTRKIPLFINGEFMHGGSDQSLPVTNPATQEVLAEVTFATAREVDFAVASAKEAFETWRDVPISARARLMLRYQD
jgi:malonate-semialdehyde dehydrogenase (acetylating)/methylmalonate-semialdehyde dehydrogenase